MVTDSKTKRFNWKWLGLLGLVLVILGGIYLIFFRSGQTDYEFITADVTCGDIKNMVSATGSLQAVLTVQVGSQVSGQIDELFADFNSVVRRGQLLARIDRRNFETQVQNASASLAAAQARIRMVEADIRNQHANVASAKANLEVARVARDNAQLVYRRYTELSGSGVISQNDFDTAKANADSAEAKYTQAQASIEQSQAQILSAQAQLEQARAQEAQAKAELDRSEVNLEYCNIYCPVDGVVISRSVDVGQTVAASLQAPTLFVIANDLTQMQVNASIDEADIGKISQKVQTQFTVDSYPNDTFRGQIAEIRLNPQTVQNVVTYSVIINVDNPDLKLKPGMTANVSLTVEERTDVLKVPNAALRYLPPGFTRDQVMAKLREQAPSRMEETGAHPVQAGTAGSSGSAAALPGAQPSRPAAGNRMGEDRRASQMTSHAGGSRSANQRTTPADEASAAASMALAPGQHWSDSEKIQFPTQTGTRTRPGIVWVLDSARKPQIRQILLGISNGSATEIVGGELNPGDTVIIGDTSQTETATQTRSGSGASMAPGFGPSGPPRR